MRSGRPCQLDAPQQQSLCAILDSGPVAYGFVSGVWTSPMIARVRREDEVRPLDPVPPPKNVLHRGRRRR
jgi:hypothetical protein